MRTTDSSSSDRRLLSVREVADRLSVHPDTVRKWIRDGAVTPTRVGPPGNERRGIRVSAQEARKLED